MKEIQVTGIDRNKRPIVKSRVAEYSEKGKVFPLKKKIHSPKLVASFVTVLCLGILGFIYYVGHDYINMVLGSNCEGNDCPGFGIFADEPELKKDGNFTNALFVGIDTREDQPGLMNTDTIMVISYNHETKNVTMISLPRDLYVKIPAFSTWWGRINSVYAQGFREGEHEEGINDLVSVVEEITGLNIQYNAMINYNGFHQLIDELGGIDVYVENEFWGRYPKGLGWEQVHFEEGWQHMDGDTALKYARTRYANAESGEASDFARARRQQIVLTAVKDKMLSIDTLANPMKLADLIKVFGANVQLSEYNQEDIRAGIRIAQNMDNTQITNMVLDPTFGGGGLISVIPNEAYYIGATSGSWAELNDYIAAILQNPDLFKEEATIYTYNGGAPVGEAGVVAESILALNSQLNVVIGGNMANNDFIGTTIYDFTNGQKPATIRELQRILPEATVATEIPENVDNAFNEDVVIVVGGEEVDEEITVE